MRDQAGDHQDSASSSSPTAEIHEDSYLYERVIDALIAFVGRFARTTWLILSGRRSSEPALLAALDVEHPRYMRPMAYVATTYIAFVFVASRAFGIGTERFTGATQSVFGSLGEAEIDVIMLAILVPLPMVLVVATASHGAAGRIVGATATGRARLAAMMQYAVGQALWRLILLQVVVYLLSWVALFARAAGVLMVSVDAQQIGLLDLAAAAVGIGGVVAVVLAAAPPVFRALVTVPGIPEVSPKRAALLSGFGPVSTLVSILAVLVTMTVATFFEEPVVRFHVAEPQLAEAPVPAVRGTALVTARVDEPFMVLDLAALWVVLSPERSPCDAILHEDGTDRLRPNRPYVRAMAPLTVAGLPLVLEPDQTHKLEYSVAIPEALRQHQSSQLTVPPSPTGEAVEAVSPAAWAYVSSDVEVLRPVICARTSLAPDVWLHTRK